MRETGHVLTGPDRQVADIRPPFIESQEDRERLRAVARQAVAAGVRNVYFVGCGGSLAASYPVYCLLDANAVDIAAFHTTSNEFNFRTPRRLGPDSLVVVATHTGTTPETLAAVKTARNAGAALVVGFTRDAESPLATAVDAAFAYGSVKTAWGPKQVMLAHLGHALLEATGVTEDETAIAAAYDALPEALPRAIRETDDLCRRVAADLRAEPIIYVLGSGPLESTAYTFSMCYLQEMQWMHSASFNAGEFLHGAFEVVTNEVPVIVLLGEDATRPMAERALAFLRRYTPKAYAIDSRDLSLPGVPVSLRGEIGPIALDAVTTRLAQHFEAARDHDLATRRYMFAVEY
jgi:fructoselysine 6-phosphate deglycase